MKLYIVRHGETECNVKRVYYGSLDVSITEKGREQAAAVGDMLRDVVFDKVIIHTSIGFKQLKNNVKGEC